MGVDTTLARGYDGGMNNDAQGNRLAIIRACCTGPNTRCRRAYRSGRTVHIIPVTDHENFHIALPTYHYTSRDEALAALEIAMNTAITVDNPADRDAAYKAKVPVKILKHTGNF